MTSPLHPLVEEWLALAIRLRVSNAAEETVTARGLGRGDVERDHEEHAKDNKGKDPLQTDDLDGELPESQGWKYILAESY